MKYFSELDSKGITLVLHVARLLEKKSDNNSMPELDLTYLLKKETRELVLKNRYLIEDIEILKLIMELTTLNLVITEKVVDDPYLTASFYVYKNIAETYRMQDRAPEGIVSRPV